MQFQIQFDSEIDNYQGRNLVLKLVLKKKNKVSARIKICMTFSISESCLICFPTTHADKRLNSIESNILLFSWKSIISKALGKATWLGRGWGKMTTLATLFQNLQITVSHKQILHIVLIIIGDWERKARVSPRWI